MTSSTPISSVVLTRYAGALVDLAEKAKSIEKVQKDLRELEAMISSSPELSQVIFSPRISSERQSIVVAEISKKAKLQKLTKNFLGVLAQNRRLNALLGIIHSFDKQVLERSGQVSVRVETAQKMTAKQEKDLQVKIASVIGTDVVVETQITPEILGGMIVTIGSYMIDDSVRRKLERLSVVMKQGSNQNTIQNLKEVV